jgi:hypothetical protein
MAAALLVGTASSISPVAIFMTVTAFEITSAGRPHLGASGAAVNEGPRPRRCVPALEALGADQGDTDISSLKANQGQANEAAGLERRESEGPGCHGRPLLGAPAWGIEANRTSDAADPQ